MESFWLAAPECIMKEEWSITREEAREVSALIWEYLSQGGTSLDNRSLERVGEALIWADRIRIVANEEDLDNEH
jgi:hypothetical protein